MNLFFYDVDLDYVNHLKAAEKAERGFTRVPDIEYQNEKNMSKFNYLRVLKAFCNPFATL
jgi:protein AbiQ